MKKDVILENKAVADQLGDNVDVTGLETSRNMNRMGVGSWRPDTLQFLNHPMVFVVFFGIGNLFTVLSFGIISVIMTTLEKTFNLNSMEVSVILLGNDISGLFASLLLANYSSSRKIRWIALGMFAVVVSSLLPACATLFAEYPEFTGDDTSWVASGVSGVCNPGGGGFFAGGDEVADYAIHNHSLFWLFVAGSLMLGIGGSPPGIAGPTYMDEIFTQKEFGFAISLLYVITFMGFPIAVLFGAATLTHYVTLDAPAGMTPDSDAWVGAWWVGFFVPAVVVFLVTFVVMLFPRQMPAAEKVLKDKIAKGQTTVAEKQTELHRDLLQITKDTGPAFKRILTNKSLNFLVLGDALIFLQIGSISYLPKIYAIAFRLGFSEVGTVIGLSNFVAFILGLVLGGAVMRLKDWHPRKLFLIYAVSVLVSTPFIGALFLHCDSNVWGGVDVRYPGTGASGTGNISFLDTCNSNCSCSTAFPSPVCDEGVTYFSQCHAGCYDGELDADNKVTKYTNCSCTSTGEATPGECGTTCQTKLIISMALTVFGTMVNFAGYAAHATVYQRVVNEVDRTIAQGWRQFMTRVLGTLPAPILFGYIFDHYCTIWRETNGVVGNCWVYDVDSLVSVFVWVQVVIKTVSVVLYFVGWYLFPLEPIKLEIKDNNYELENK